MHLAGNVVGAGMVLAILGAGGVSSRGAEATKPPPQERLQFSGAASDKLLYEESEATKSGSRFDFLDRNSSVGGALPGSSVGGAGAAGTATLLERFGGKTAGSRGWVLDGAEQQDDALRFEKAVDLWGQAARASKRSQQFADLLGDGRADSSKPAPRRTRNPAGDALGPALSFSESAKTTPSLDPLVDVSLGTPTWAGAGARGLATESVPGLGLATSPSLLPAAAESPAREASLIDTLNLQKSFREILGSRGGSGQQGEDGEWLDLQVDSTREEVNPVVGNRWRITDSPGRASQTDPWNRPQESATSGQASALRQSLLERMTDKTMGPSSLAPALPLPSVLDSGRPALKGSSIELPARKF